MDDPSGRKRKRKKENMGMGMGMENMEDREGKGVVERGRREQKGGRR